MPHSLRRSIFRSLALAALLIALPPPRKHRLTNLLIG